MAEPSEWYAYHRKPLIIEYDIDKERVLVEFSAIGYHGEFGGRCLYARCNEKWDCYMIRPNQSSSIAVAEKWLIKRDWKEW